MANTLEGIRNFVSLSDKLATGGQPSEEQVRELARAGFEVVVNLGVLDPRYCLPDEAGLAESLGMTYHHIPVDFKAPLFESLRKFFHVMDASHDKRVFVHCAANYRVSAFMALYGQVRLGWSIDEANAHIQRLWDPNDTWKEFIEASRRNLADPIYSVVPFSSTSISDVDLEALLRLVYVAGGFTEASIADSLFFAPSVRARGEVIVAQNPLGNLLGAVVAVPFGSPACRLANSGEAELHLLCVHPETRGRGIGSALVDAAVGAARRGGASRMILWTQSSMTVARRLYEKNGFERVPALDFSRGKREFLVFARPIQSG